MFPIVFGDLFGENGIVVVDQKPWRGVIWERLGEMLNDPARCRVGGNPNVQNFPSSVTDHEPCVQKSESNGRDDQKVHRRDAVFVISKKCLPSLSLISIRISLR